MAPHEREAMKEAMDMLLHRGDMCDWTGTHDRVVIDALRTALAQSEKEWVGLTDDDVMSLLPGAIRLPPGWADTVRAIEAKLKEKNNG